MKKRTLSLILVMLLVIMSAAVVPTCAAKNEIITGTFTYMPSFVDEPATDDFYYSDAYFTAPASQQNQHLITMSMALALASMEIGGDSYVTALLKNIGYSDIQTDDMTITPTIDTIGTAIAHKSIDGHDVVAVSIRGNKYGAEWASNLTAGSEGNIEGFDTAAEKVIARVKDYIAAHHLSNVKLWIAGYSRAGSAADLTGVYLNEHPDEFNTAADDLYIYCFEAPRCCASDKVYDNIFCVKNKNDIITNVYPKSWGLYTNGVEIVTGEDLTVNKVKIDMLDADKIVVLGEMPMDEFNEDFVSFLANELTRDMFSGEFDGAIAKLLEMYFGKSTAAWNAVFESLGGSLSEIVNNPRARYILTDEIQCGAMFHDSDAMYRQIADELEILLKELVPGDQLPISAEEYQEMLNTIYPLIRTLGPVLVKDYKYKAGVDYSTVLPEDYDDPTYDPQTAEEKIPTYDQYVEAEQNWTEEPEEPEEPVTDAQQGEDDGRSDGYDRGYEDGLAGNEPLTEAPLPADAESRSQEYLEAYRNGYMSAYESAYEYGYKEANPEHSEDYYRGFNDADDQVGIDAKKDALAQQFRASYNEEPIPHEDSTPYSQDYLDGYHSRYREFYDGYYRSYTEYYEELNLYHFATLFVNRETIIKQHYPQTNWELVKAMDAYYDKANMIGDADGDGDVTILDATRIQRWLAELCDMDGSAYTGKELTQEQVKAADADGDGDVTILDATRIQRRLAGIPVPFPISE